MTLAIKLPQKTTCVQFLLDKFIIKYFNMYRGLDNLICNEWHRILLLQFTKPGSDTKMLGEMMYGSVAMSYKGASFKVHSIRYHNLKFISIHFSYGCYILNIGAANSFYVLSCIRYELF